MWRVAGSRCAGPGGGCGDASGYCGVGTLTPEQAPSGPGPAVCVDTVGCQHLRVLSRMQRVTDEEAAGLAYQCRP